MREKTDSKVISGFAKRGFPAWRGRKLFVQVSDRARTLASYWDGGSKDSFVVLHLGERGNVVKVSYPPMSAPFSAKAEPYVPVKGQVLVEHSIFMGKDGGCTVYIHPDDVGLLGQTDSPTV